MEKILRIFFSKEKKSGFVRTQPAGYEAKSLKLDIYVN
jgi:hypothetical protein